MTIKFHSDSQGDPDSMSADIEAALRAVAFPANKDAIVAAAQSSGVSNEVIVLLTGLDERDYPNANAVMAQL